MNVITATDRGLYCADGDFYIDPWQPVPHAVLTHAHGDHARSGSAVYIAAEAGAGLLRHRLGADLNLRSKAYGEIFELGSARVSLHSAGHVLGSAQVRIEMNGAVWVVTGDYKRAADPTCESFEPVRCDVLISEATFALPCLLLCAVAAQHFAKEFGFRHARFFRGSQSGPAEWVLPISAGLPECHVPAELQP